MRETIPFTYTVNEIPPRCRKARPVDKTGSTEVHVNELEAGKLPVAFVVHHYDEEKVIRAYDGRFFTLARSQNQKYLTIGELRNTLVCFGRRNWYTQNAYEICAELQKFADKYIIVGDSVYEEIGEPRYCIYTFGLGHNHGGTSFSVDYRFNENIPADRYFSALQYEEAIAKACDIANARGDTKSICRFRNREYIDVIDENYVQCHPTLHSGGNQLLNRMENIIECCDSADEAAMAILAAQLMP